jgi:hypothetical protein
VVDLQRRVIEAEALQQHRLQLAPGRVAVGLAIDEHVRSERRKPRRDRPHVKVVDLLDAADLGHRPADLLNLHVRR